MLRGIIYRLGVSVALCVPFPLIFLYQGGAGCRYCRHRVSFRLENLGFFVFPSGWIVATVRLVNTMQKEYFERGYTQYAQYTQLLYIGKGLFSCCFLRFLPLNGDCFYISVLYVVSVILPRVCVWRLSLGAC